MAKYVYLCGITYGYDAFTDSSIFWEHLDKVCSHSDQIWVSTFRAVSAYCMERENVKITTKRKRGKLIVTPEFSLDADLFNEPLTMVIESKETIRKVKVIQGGKTLPTKPFSTKIVFNFKPNDGSIVIEL